MLIVAHGNTLRGLIKYAERISDQAIADLNIPTAIPMVYEVEDDMRPIRRHYLGDPETVKKAAEAVADQLKKQGFIQNLRMEFGRGGTRINVGGR